MNSVLGAALCKCVCCVCGLCKLNWVQRIVVVMCILTVYVYAEGYGGFLVN